MLVNYSHYSVLQSILKPKEIIDIAVRLERDSVGLCDINTMAGIVQFVQAAKKVGIKPILGCTFLNADEDKLAIFARNKTGYLNLLKLFAKVNSKENFFIHPVLTNKILESCDLKGLIAVTGHDTSVYQMMTVENGDYNGYLNTLKSLFEHVFLVSDDGTYGHRATQLCYDNNNSSSYLYQIITSTRDKCPISSLGYQPSRGAVKHDISFVSDLCEEYDIISGPKLPHFDCPDGLSPIEYMKKLCWEGFKTKVTRDKDSYLERIKSEIEIFEKAGLAEYFLILEDVVRFCKRQKFTVGPGRGSVGGCLASYLLGITKIDPLKYNLLFGRFYSDGRKGSLPDIDIDFPKHARAQIIQYTIDKYGAERTGQISTYQTLMGRAALKAVFRAENKLSFQEMTEITNHLEDKSKIADELQLMKDAGRDPSVIMWALENKAHKFTEWVKLEKDGKLSGDLANQFQYAIELEGIKSAASRHACGFIIGAEPLQNFVPMMYDETSEKQIVGMEYEDAEKLGAVKVDYLSLSSLDRLEDINKY